MMKLKFWEKEKTGGKHVKLSTDERQSQDRLVRLDSFLNEECNNKCFVCPDCIKKLEKVVK